MLVCFFREVRLQQLLKGVQEVHQLRQQRTICVLLWPGLAMNVVLFMISPI